jgi:hypothetical protein
MNTFKTIITFFNSDKVLRLNGHHSLDDRFVASVEHDNYPLKVKSIEVVDYEDDHTSVVVEWYEASTNEYYGN